MSARSKARKAALDILFESDIRATVALDILASRDIVEEGPDARPIREYTREIVIGVSEHRRKIDELIRVPLSKKILFDRLADCAVTGNLVDDCVEFTVDTPEPKPVVDPDGYIVLE